MDTRKPKVITTQGSTVRLTGNLNNFLTKQQEEPADAKESTSYLGTPIYTSLVFKAISGKDLNNIPPDVRQIVSQDLVLTEVLLTINESKNIKRTALNGRDGTVKEYISDGDYSITVNGKIVSEHPNLFPKEDVKSLRSFMTLKQSLEIGNAFLSLFGITNIVVNDYSFHELQGYRNQIEFRLLMWSDTDFKIEPTQNATS